jgi:acrylyl-CoA reductase (NADPH)
MYKVYKALRVYETSPGKLERSIDILNTRNLPSHEVPIMVKYSGLNYKDALSAFCNRGVTRQYPFTPGIDAAGVVEHSSLSRFKPGADSFKTCLNDCLSIK